MAELLASWDDVNAHLPGEGRLVADEDNADDIQTGVHRIIRGYLSGVFTPATLAGWTTPGTTPVLIREVASKLIASQLYQRLFGGDSTDYSAYARALYEQAMDTLREVRDRTIILVEVLDDTEGTISILDFYPNAEDDQPPKFTMNSVF